MADPAKDGSESDESGATPPKAFLSHASEDKSRFVIDFAKQLRARGVDVWLDQWEMRPGDSLVDKIFETGIGGASVVIVVISRNSIEKPWVREELDAAIVQRINERSQLIPVVLDGITPDELPVAIQHLLFEAVSDTTAFGPQLDRVVDAVFGRRPAPELGPAPVFVSTEALHGHSTLDTTVFRAIGDEAVRDNGTMFMTQEFLASLKHLGVAEESLIESLEVLDQEGRIEIARTMGSGVGSMHRFTLTFHGLLTYLQSFVPDFEAQYQAVCVRLCNLKTNEQTADHAIAEALGCPVLIVSFVFDHLEVRGLVKQQVFRGMGHTVWEVSPKLKRLAAEGRTF